MLPHALGSKTKESLWETSRSCHLRCFLKSVFLKILFIKEWLQHRCFLWILKNFQKHLFLKHLQTSASEHLWCNTTLSLQCKDMVEPILKSDLTFQKNCFISFNKSLLKTMKNSFYFILTAFSFSRYLSFSPGLLVM